MRYLQLDFIRGIAIILMIIFHISFDLNHFHFIEIDIYNKEGFEWFYFRMFILTLFMISVGISLAVVNEKKIESKKVLKRFLTLITASITISIATLIIFPNSWIYFGVLHFVAFASLIALLFVEFEWIALGIGIAIITLFNLKIIDMNFLFEMLQPLLNLPRYTEDLVPFTPWFGVVLVGIFIGKKRLFLFPLTNNRIIDSIAFLGKNSLIIYLVHQPLFFGVIAGASFLCSR
ncbi:MAG: heparan-alpha-glucosaminide N-acetyltransferase [Campylobacterota bacterium]|nr:heparan-alpha-glucosaminide N-acetyltransferase [Campylobacterota bacterium]